MTGDSDTVTNLEDVKAFREKHEAVWYDLINLIDRTLSDARDQGRIPIYATKGRIKQAESAYLKFKRKNRNNPHKITDWIGVRVLCLFQQDIYDAFEFLLDLLLNQSRMEGPAEKDFSHFELDEINIFNWPKDKVRRLLTSLESKLDLAYRSRQEQQTNDGLEIAFTYVPPGRDARTISFTVRQIERGSGYQSIHFVAGACLVSGDEVDCEIQLRTLLQDVWGELEHALSYKKGQIHPHISSSFSLLAKELEAKDILVSQLRTLRDQETALVRYSTASAGPTNWFSYPEAWLREVFVDDESKEAYAQLSAFCSKRRIQTDPLHWEETAVQLLGRIERALAEKDSPQTAYVLAMEKAYVDFCCGRFDAAAGTYKDVVATTIGAALWFPFFRQGELSLAQDRIEDALVAFDQCESLMQGASGGIRDRYYAKVGLAYSYWSLGAEFLETAIVKMEDARAIVTEELKSDRLTPEEKAEYDFSLANNLCYYYTELWISVPPSATALSARDKHVRKQNAEGYFGKLRGLVDASTHKDTISSNTYDTLAWFCHQMSIRTTEPMKKEYRNKARVYIQEAEHHRNLSPSRLISTALQREHMKEILVSAPE